MEIRREQMQALADERRALFEERLIAHLENAYPEKLWTSTPEAVRERVRRAVDKALSYSVRTERDVTSFVDLTFELGEGFDIDPRFDWAGEILRDDSLDGRDKVARIKHALLL